MLITKFNRMIRNRFIWTVVAIVVSLSFVMSFSSVRGCDSNTGADMGLLLGKPVDFDEFRMATHYELNFQDRSALPTEERERLDEFVWRRLAMVRLAGEMGLQAPDDEIRDWVTERFTANGVFDRNRYIQFVNSLRVPINVFEDYLRQDRSLQKITGIAGSLAWVGERELDWRLRNLTDVLTLNYSVIDRATFTAPDLTVDDEAVLAYYQKHEDLFRTEPQVSVKYVQFPLADFVSEAPIEFAAISNHYTANRSTYVRVTPGTNTTAIAPIEDVADEIAEHLRQRRQVNAAVDTATEFLVALQPRFGGASSPMEEVATTLGRKVETSPLFSASAPTPELPLTPDFLEEAFALKASDPHLAYSRIPFVGSNAVFVIAAGERQESSLPAFEDVRPNATTMALAEAQDKAFDAWVAALHADLTNRLATGKSITDAAGELNLVLTTNIAFSVYANLTSNTFAYAEALQPLVPSITADTLLEPIEVPEGALIVHVAQRAAGTPEVIAEVTPQLRNTLAEYRARLVHTSLGEQLLENEGPEALRAAKSAKPQTPEAPSGG